MTEAEIRTLIEVAGLLGSLSTLAWLALWWLPAYEVDQCREELFALRDELFRLGAVGTIPFTSPAYRKLRQLINSHIRWAHRLGVLRLILIEQTVARTPGFASIGELEHSEWTAAIDGLSPEAAIQVQRLRALTQIQVLQLTACASAFGLVTFWILRKLRPRSRRVGAMERSSARIADITPREEAIGRFLEGQLARC